MLQVATFVEEMGNKVMVGTMGGWLMTRDKKDASYARQEIRFTFSDTLDIADSFANEAEISPIILKVYDNKVANEK